MLKHVVVAAGLVLTPAAVLAQNQGQPNGLPEPPSMGQDMLPRFQRYVTEQRRTSFSYDQPVTIGTTLPASGVTYYEVPREYGAGNYRYTVVNNRTVLVDPGTRRIVQIVD